MRRNVGLSLGVAFCIFIAFFVLAPVVSMDIVPCLPRGNGYASLSYFLFNIGETYGYGHLSWLTQSFVGCR